MKETRFFVAALVAAGLAVLSGCEQQLARSFGGTLKADIPSGTQLVAVTWKGADLWVLYFDPRTNTCTFKENSTYGVMEGAVVIANCNPVAMRMGELPK